MKRQHSLSFVLLMATLFTVGCKTQEQIKREQLVDNLSMQMVEGQKLTADSSVRLQQIEERLGMVTGQIEENGQNSRQYINETVKNLQERISLLEESNKTYKDLLNSIQSKLGEQDKYMKEVLASLSKITGGSAPSKKKVNSDPYDTAIGNYRNGKYSVAKNQLIALLDTKKYKGTKRAALIHNLGMIAYFEKNDKDAMIYFGRLFTEHPESGYNGNGLFYLAKVFTRSGQENEAKQTLQELVQKYPKHKKAKEAKELLKK